MAHFYGTVSGRSRTMASRLGHRGSGIVTKAASWAGAVMVTLYERDDVDFARVELVPHHGHGTNRVLYGRA